MVAFDPYGTLRLVAALVMSSGRSAFTGGAPLFLGGPGSPRKSKDRRRACKRSHGWREEKRARRRAQKHARRMTRRR